MKVSDYEQMSEYLTSEYGRGFSRSNLAGMRKFYLTYKDREPQIVQSGIGQLTVDYQSFPFKLSWTHYQVLMTIEDPAERNFYELEAGVLNRLQDFLLEMGKGFLFERRQRRFTFNDKNFYLDLVLYNRFLRCYVLIDFKVDELTHQDLGQMQMYVNYYDRYEIIDGENPTIDILMCKQSDEALVELTLPKDSNIYAKEYKLYLPDKKLLKEKLQEWIEEADIVEDGKMR